MFNSEKPSLEELPTSSQLLRSTILAAISALVILVAVILPAEYAIDPTGAGRLLGLTEMGEIKEELTRESEEDRLKHGDPDQSSSLLDQVLDLFVGTARAEEAWRDTVTFTLAPGAPAEIKLVMRAQDSVEYSWVAEGGRINYDLHAHAPGQSIDYEKGRGKTSGTGRIEAPFAGEHGWFWRNRDRADVTITLQLRGSYSEILQSQ